MRRDEAGLGGVTAVLTGAGAGADLGGAVACTRTHDCELRKNPEDQGDPIRCGSSVLGCWSSWSWEDFTASQPKSRSIREAGPPGRNPAGFSVPPGRKQPQQHKLGVVGQKTRLDYSLEDWLPINHPLPPSFCL